MRIEMIPEAQKKGRFKVLLSSEAFTTVYCSIYTHRWGSTLCEGNGNNNDVGQRPKSDDAGESVDYPFQTLIARCFASQDIIGYLDHAVREVEEH